MTTLHIGQVDESKVKDADVIVTIPLDQQYYKKIYFEIKYSLPLVMDNVGVKDFK